MRVRHNQSSGQFIGAKPCLGTRRRRGVAVALVSVLLAAGSCGASVTRDCAASSNTRASKWQAPAVIGQSVSFVDDQGNNVMLVLRNRTDSEAYTGFDKFGEPEDLGCRATSERRYDFDDRVSLNIQFTQFESTSGQAIDEHPVIVTIHPQSPAGELLAYDIRFHLGDTLSLYGDEGVTQFDTPISTLAQEKFEIGDALQSLTVEQFYTDAAYVTDLSPNAASLFTRMVISDGVDLIAFERADGARFVRTDPGVS